MASTLASAITIVGTDATPVTLGATGGASDVGTWTHNLGKRAKKIVVLAQTTRVIVPNASITVTQPTVNQIVLTNTTAGPLSVVVEVTFEYPSASLGAPVPASAVALS